MARAARRARSASPSARARRSSRRSTNLGAIVVDEEHESSYKQGETPRYHAREVAMVRARQRGRGRRARQRDAESRELGRTPRVAKYTLLTLPERVGEATVAEDRRRSIAAKRRAADAVASPQRARRGRLASPRDQRRARARAVRPAREERAEHSPAQSPRIRRVRSMRRLRRRRDVPELLDQSHLSSHARAARLPLLPARGAAAHGAVRDAKAS